LKERRTAAARAVPAGLARQLPFAVWLKDTESRFLAVNQGFVSLFGQRSCRNWLARPTSTSHRRIWPKAIVSDDRAVLASGKKKNVEEEIVDAAGTRKWFETYKAPVLEDSGRVVGTVGFARDITERRAGALAMEEMSKALATSRDLLQQVIDTAPICVFWKDREGRYLGCNPAFAHDAGKSTPSELIGRDDFAMGWAAQADLYRSDDQAVMQTGQPRLNYEEPQTTPDGKIHWLRTSKVPLRDATGLVIGLLGLYDDITEQKRAERRLALALDASKILVWEMDFTTGKLDYDGSSMKGLGLDKADAPDTLAGWLARVHSDDRTRFTANVEKALQPEDTRGLDCEYRFDDNAGGYNWLQSTGRVVQRDLAGRPLLAAGYSVNIDERRRSNESLRLAASVFSHAREGITITDANGIIIDVNAAFTRITGYTRDEVLGRSPNMLSSGRQDKAFYAAMWQALINQGHWTGELWNRRKDGQVIAELLTISAVYDAQGKTRQYVGLFSDITELKEHESQLDRMAHFDALTSLPNRRLLADRLQQALVQAVRRGQTLALAYLDLDGFKLINDTHGHAVGDQVLITLAPA
jgi:PAS domain S-box-containing protein